MTPSLQNLKPEQRELLAKAFGNAIPDAAIVSATLENQRRAIAQSKRIERNIRLIALVLIIFTVLFTLITCGA